MELKITLRETRPAVWRRLVVPTATTLSQLHAVFQVAMGWDNYHLHAFRRREVVYADPEQLEDMDVRDESAATLAELLAEGWQRFVYEYDFGDNWQHDVVVERPADEGVRGFLCTAGKRACPPEDVGGPWGYQEHLAILADPSHEEHAERIEWRGQVDPEAFSLDAVNAQLRAFPAPRSRRVRRRG